MNDEARKTKARGSACLFRHSIFVIRHFLGGVLIFLFIQNLAAAEVIPPKPEKFFNDYANVVSSGVAHQLNETLAQFERDTSNQLVVAIFPKMQTDSSLEDYTQRIFREWKPGQKDKNNGAILFVYLQEHKMRIHTGYGLEGAMPDITCKRIIDDEIAPHFKQRDFDGGLTAGVNAMLAAVRGEYKGTGRTQRESHGRVNSNIGSLIFFLVFVAIIILTRLRRSTPTAYGAAGRRNWNQGWYIDTTSSSGGGFFGGGGGSGGFSGGGDSGFSGGGGDSGGGGASGSW
jgi:uncharacterized protein